jgi:hypothetical protein
MDNSPNIGKLDMEKEARWADERAKYRDLLNAEVARICGMAALSERRLAITDYVFRYGEHAAGTLRNCVAAKFDTAKQK